MVVSTFSGESKIEHNCGVLMEVRARLSYQQAQRLNISMDITGADRYPKKLLGTGKSIFIYISQSLTHIYTLLNIVIG